MKHIAILLEITSHLWVLTHTVFVTTFTEVQVFLCGKSQTSPSFHAANHPLANFCSNKLPRKDIRVGFAFKHAVILSEQTGLFLPGFLYFCFLALGNFKLYPSLPL